MNPLKLIACLLVLYSCLLASCGAIRTPDGTVSMREAWRIAENAASREGIPLKSYKHQKALFVPDSNHWCLTFEERGYLLAVGDQFAVLIDGRTQKSKVLREAGFDHPLTRRKLENEIQAIRIKAGPSFHR